MGYRFVNLVNHVLEIYGVTICALLSNIFEGNQFVYPTCYYFFIILEVYKFVLWSPESPLVSPSLWSLHRCIAICEPLLVSGVSTGLSQSLVMYLGTIS